MTEDRSISNGTSAPSAPIFTPGSADFYLEGGEMGRRMREFDWSKTPLGPTAMWPQSLRTAVSLILNSRHPMWIGWGPEMTFLYNDAYISVLSLAKHPWALGRPATEVWREIWDVCGPLARKVFEHGEATFVDDVRLFMSRGDFLEETFYSFSYSPIHDEFGHVAGLFCPSAESTAKILNERRLKTLSDLAARALVEKTLPSACAAAVETLGRNPDDIPFGLLYLSDAEGKRAELMQAVGVPVGRADLSPYHVDLGAGEAVAWPIADVLAKSCARLVSVEHLDGLPVGLAAQRVREAVVLPLSSPSERPYGALILGVNPTRPFDSSYQTFFELAAGHVATAIQNARTVEHEKRRAEELAEIDRAKTIFFSNVSHEFRTPLTLMLGPLEDALRGGQLAEADAARLSIVRRNGLRLMKLVNALLDFSRIEAGRARAVFEPVDLAKQVEDLASVFRSAIERAGLKYVIDVSPMPQPAFLDREMWEKIVFNLLSNALKFTFEGEIEVRLRAEDGLAKLTVRDTGTGISETELPKLFRRFHRIEGARGRSHEGSGIGLALVQELVKMHGGNIEVESRLGAGTTFSVTMPLGSAHLPKDQLGGRRENSPEGTWREAFLEEAMVEAEVTALVEATGDKLSKPEALASSVRVVLVDDNADMRRYLAGMLSGYWQVETYANGQEALEAIRRRPPDLVLSDVMMPVLDGFGLLRALRGDPATSALPIILLSARAGEEAVIEGVQAGADDYLVKPFSAKELLARVRAQLELKRLRAEVLMEKGRLDQVFQQAPVGIVILEGPNHIFRMMNPAGMEYCFGGPRDVLGKSLLEAIPELEGQRFKSQLDEVYRTGKPYNGTGESTAMRLNRSGEIREFFLDYCYQPKRDADGQIDGVLAVFSDVTERVLATRQLERTTESLRTQAQELARSNAELAQFAYVASHDLKEPLRVVRNHLQLLQRKVQDQLPPSVLPHMGFVMEASGRMYDLVDDLLEYARVGVSREDTVTVDTARAVQLALTALATSVTESGAEIIVDKLPAVHAVPTQMQQLFQNLIGNALKFRGPAAPRIRISAEAGAREVTFSVKDNGIGIALEYAAKIFEIFQRLHDRATYPGTGIGLAICKKIVEQHGGKIWVVSKENDGADFRFTLPMAEGA